MAKGKGPKVQTVALRNNNTGKVTTPQGIAGTGTNNFAAGRAVAGEQKRAKLAMPQVEVGSRYSPYVAMCVDPVTAAPALPPVALPSRAMPVRTYQEIILSTDASGNAGVSINPRMKSMYYTVSTWSGTTATAYAAAGDNSEYTSFNSNFYQYIPLVMEVQMKYTGSANVVAGRMYGIVSPNYTGNLDVTTFPLDINGCEALTSEGISCTWYSTLPVWANPILSGATANASEVGDVTIMVALVGGPASVTNLLTVGVYFHFAGMPRGGVCGLTPQASIPDTNAATIAALLQASSSGMGASALTIPQRNKTRSKKGHIKDVIKIGGKVLGTIAPHLGQAAGVAEALAMLML